jgi:WD40 repeat protein
MNPLTSSPSRLKNAGTKILSSIPDERLYFAGLKNSAMYNQRNSSNSVTDYITDLIMDNPLTTIGAGIVAGMGLYYGTKSKKPVQTNDISKNYSNAIKSIMTGTACLIASSGVVKYMTQEPVEIDKLRQDLKSLDEKRKISVRKKKKAIHKKSVTPINDTITKMNYYDKEIATLFAH